MKDINCLLRSKQTPEQLIKPTAIFCLSHLVTPGLATVVELSNLHVLDVISKEPTGFRLLSADALN